MGKQWQTNRDNRIGPTFIADTWTEYRDDECTGVKAVRLIFRYICNGFSKYLIALMGVLIYFFVKDKECEKSEQKTSIKEIVQVLIIPQTWLLALIIFCYKCMHERIEFLLFNGRTWSYEDLRREGRGYPYPNCGTV
ncbi:hypothetical protein [Paenibacillus sp. LHD-38]|uniref:hypothetical protein n=1 Tax=Paenibacillus sp. LHD-38 TaxID=3072143 RepID=UPI00280EA698|nr:hypothetical protein [Paenibacillus sp. LHD-38]MDQ8736409.1 hypothetical protein [Paenibacillus sp. LHD-38]